MKKRVFTIIALLFLISVSIQSFGNETQGMQSNAIHFYNETSDLPVSTDENIEFYVSYLLDANGKPYIISIRSKDEQMTQMVKKMINVPADQYPMKDGNWYSVTFIYNNIQ
ncbi:MAG: hypothetical protein KDD32_08275 [Bacteroidetes bacterium]|nr:hypothetical protein [Bacteroidota bacterium]